MEQGAGDRYRVGHRGRRLTICHPPQPSPRGPKGLFDDIFISLGVLLQGSRVVRAPEFRAYESHTTEPEDEYRRKIRIACECMHVHLTLWPELAKLDPWNLYKYLTHRLARWLGGYFFALSGAFYLLALASWMGILNAALLVASAVCLFILVLRMRLGVAQRIWTPRSHSPATASVCGGRFVAIARLPGTWPPQPGTPFCPAPYQVGRQIQYLVGCRDERQRDHRAPRPRGLHASL